ncbi:Pr6Pr family membrane protein [Nocardia vermiculata]|uniref:Pr6Pr family membrane protein n=1 Tax=Nocardia vermiculata TaxID=257274 RepID=A0A846Y5Z5_9NOCA|nr:Pr6Pr family membrane protein [Nocardia vermiculata]NKY53320.1 Pr6Pr family membrane protein [Nocardia vermiculata]
MIARAGTPMWIRIARIAFGLFGAVALVWVPVHDVSAGTFVPETFFSYFTVESNLLGVVVLLIGGLLDPVSPRWQLVRGAVTLYLLITGVVYALLLAGADVSLDDRWVNDTLHRVMPVVLVVDWVLIPAGLRISARLIGGWLIYPVVFCGYSLVRGAFVDWYPYPFLDPRGQGYVSLLLGVVILAVFFALMAVAVAWVGSPRRLRSTTTTV